MNQYVTWRPLDDDDIADLMALSSAVIAADGGLPDATSELFLRDRYLSPHLSMAGWRGAELVAVGGFRVLHNGQLTGIGQVHPDHRGLGLGRQVLDWALNLADTHPLRLETESLTAAADKLFASSGFQQVFAEDVMRCDLRDDPPATALGADHFAADIELTEWTPATAYRFFSVYERAFADRPGFPGWPAEQWIAWTGDDIAPQWTLLATQSGVDVGFITSAREGFIVQVGVLPQARRAGLGAALTTEALRRMRADGLASALLDVNVNNPGAIRIYQRLGFTQLGRRARYERPPA